MTEATAESVTVSTWPVWELINPSDPYTFRAPDVRVAGVAAFMLSPAYGVKMVNGEERSPLVTGWDEFVLKHGIDEEWIDSHAYEIAEAFDSFERWPSPASLGRDSLASPALGRRRPVSPRAGKVPGQGSREARTAGEGAAGPTDGQSSQAAAAR